MPWNRGIILCCSALPSCSMCQSPPPGKDSRGDMIQIKVWWRKWKWESFSKRGEHNRKGRRPTYGGWDCVNFHGPKIVVWEYRGKEQKEGICWTIWSHLEGMKHRRSNPKSGRGRAKRLKFWWKETKTKVWSKREKDNHRLCPIPSPLKITEGKPTLWCHWLDNLMVQDLSGLRFAKWICFVLFLI